MTEFKCWKRSQTSSGYYMKRRGELPQFIRFYRYEDGKYDIDIRKGLGGDFKNLTTEKNKSQALKFANKFMKEHDKC